MGRCGILAAVALIASGCVGGGTPVSAYDKAHMSPRAFAQRMLSQLHARLDLPESERVRNEPLDQTSLVLRPTGTEIPNLCRRDILEFEMSPAGTGKADAKTPMQLSGIHVISTFHFLSLSEGYSEEPRRRAELDGRCATVDGFTRADSAENAREGKEVFAALQKQAATLTDRSAFECAGETDGCAGLVKDVPGPWYYSKECARGEQDHCVALGWSGVDMTVRYKNDAAKIEFLAITVRHYIDDSSLFFLGGDYLN